MSNLTTVPSLRRPLNEWVTLAPVLAVALGVRLYGIDFGLPNEHARPDERHLIGYTLALGGNHLNPRFFNYPSLYLYILFTAYLSYFAFGLFTGRFSSPRDLVTEYAIHPDRLYLIDRLLVVLLGTATVALVYWIGKRAAGRRVGLLAALFLGLSYLHARDSHFGTVDVPLTFFATLAICYVLKAEDAGTLRSRFWAALVSGFAVSTKYNAVALLAPLLLLGFPRRTDARLPAVRGWLRGLPVLGVGLAAGFVLGTPFSVLDPREFIRDMSFELVNKSQMPSVDLGPGWLYHLSVTLPYGLGWPLLVAAAVGAGVSLKEGRRTALLLLAFPVAWWASTGMSHYVFARYAVPLVPMLCVFAARGVDACVRLLESRAGAPERRGGRKDLVAGWASTGLAALVLAVPTWRLALWDRLVRRTDTRVAASQWIEHHVPSGATVGVMGPNYAWPQLWNAPPQVLRSTETGGRRIRDEIRLSHLRGPSYEMYAYRTGAWHDVLNSDDALDQTPSYVIMADHPALQVEEGGLPVLGSDYALAASFQASSSVAASAVFDRQDAFYFPFAKFDGVEGPGPNLRIFRRVSMPSVGNE